MNTTLPPISPSERRAVSELLPWFVTGKLPAADVARVEAALAVDPTLTEELELVREDQDATLALADRQPMPSARVLDQLLAKVEAEPARLAHVAERARSGFMDWLGEKLQAFSPRALAYATAAGALALVIQAGVIGQSYLGGGATFQTASHTPTGVTAPQAGSFALVGFAPEATAFDIATLLTEINATIVEGPRPGGLYRIRIAPGALAPAELERILMTLRQRTGVVRFVASAP